MAISHKHVPFQYSEYISPLPADELIKIGAVKQHLYDDGVEKIQKRVQELDQYGFSLEKPSDKKYFAQEMDKYIRAVNDSAAKTDFSNMNNVRNILSISRPLETDPLLMNAIESSKELKRRQQVLASLKPELRSKANDDYFMEDAEEWYNDGKVGSKLASGKSYVPYVDINAKIAQRVKDLKGDVYKQITGSIRGKMDIATVEQLTDLKVAQIIKSELGEKEMAQLQIDARYSLKNLGKEQIQTLALNDFQKRLEEANKSIITSNEELQKAKLMYNTSPTAYNRELLENAEEKVANSTVQRQSAEENIKKFSDVNQIDIGTYYPYYVSNYITSKSRDYARTRIEHDLVTDDVYIKTLENNLASARDYQKHLYDMQEKRYEAQLKGTKFTPSGALIMPNNDPSKAISGGISTAAVSTKGGLIGENLSNIPNHIQGVTNLLSAKNKKDEYIVKDIGVRQNLSKFLNELNIASKATGPDQLRKINNVYDKWFGSKYRGSMYTSDVRNYLYQIISGRQIAGEVSPEQLRGYVQESIVDPLTTLNTQLKNSPQTRIAIKNDLNYTKEFLDGIDFLSPTGLSIFSDDQIILGTPIFTMDAGTGETKVKGGTESEVTGRMKQFP